MSRKHFNILCSTAIALLLVVSGFCAARAVSFYHRYESQKEEFDSLVSLVESVQASSGTTPQSAPTEEVTDSTSDMISETEKAMLPEYAVLYERNADIVGWMKLEDTVLNYPVMQSPQTPDYYLHRNFQGEYSAHGCLYAQEECSVDPASDNIIIYGHNMNDGSMFHVLHNYRNQEYWRQHDTITFDTLTEHHTYRIFAVFKTSVSVGEGFPFYEFADAGSEEEFGHYVTECKALSFYDTGLTPEYGDKLITLATCEYTLTNGRLIVVAYRVS